MTMERQMAMVNVLVVEDEVGLANAICKLLELSGEGIEIAEKHLRIVRILFRQAHTNVLRHDCCVNRGKPDVGILFGVVMVVMVFFVGIPFLRA